MEKPILFSTDMVKAILEGRKNVTRRVVKPQPPENCNKLFGPEMYEPAVIDKYGDLQEGKPIFGVYDEWGDYGIKCPYRPGDTLWARETWADLRGMGFDEPFAYLANSLNRNGKEDGDIKRCRVDYGVKWKPSIHMPREAARLFLTVKDVRVERLQAITSSDALAEGVTPGIRESTTDAFHNLWDKINGKRGYGWDTNCWVWVVEFEKQQTA